MKRLSRLEHTLFVTESDIAIPVPRMREACSQVDESDFDEEQNNLTRVNL